jgi:hypothetical protein
MTIGVVALLKIPGLMLVGGLALLWIAYKLLIEDEGEGHGGPAVTTFWGAMKTIVVADALMGIDNVLGVAGAAHGVLVACPPRMSRRIGKWVTHSARQAWRAKWSDKLFEQAVPAVQSPGDTVTTIVANGPLPALTRQLVLRHGAARVVDARRPKFGHELPPLIDALPGEQRAAWEVPGAVALMGAVLVLGAE